MDVSDGDMSNAARVSLSIQAIRGRLEQVLKNEINITA